MASRNGKITVAFSKPFRYSDGKGHVLTSVNADFQGPLDKAVARAAIEAGAAREVKVRKQETK